MGKCIGLLLFLASCFVCRAQSITVAYYYDECGNRVERTVRFKKIDENERSLAHDEEEGWIDKADDNIEGQPLSLYPNPTSGKFALSFSSEPPRDIQAEICTTEGSVIETRKLSSRTEEFDLTGKAAGIYILRLSAGRETRMWKIIKKH